MEATRLMSSGKWVSYERESAGRGVGGNALSSSMLSLMPWPMTGAIALSASRPVVMSLVSMAI